MYRAPRSRGEHGAEPDAVFALSLHGRHFVYSFDLGSIRAGLHARARPVRSATRNRITPTVWLLGG
jgi:hypothetical protein